MLSVSVFLGQVPFVLAQQGGGAYGAGQIVGVVFVALLIGAVVWKILKR